MAKFATFTWDTGSAVDGYNLYTSTDNGVSYTKENTSLITSNTYTAGPLNESASYQTYVVSSKDGLLSDPSNIVEFEANPSTLPASTYIDVDTPSTNYSSEETVYINVYNIIGG